MCLCAYMLLSWNGITLDGEALKEVEAYAYRGSTIDKQCGSYAEAKA